MEKPKFSIVCIAKNEAKTLPRMMASLKEFMDRGGEVVLVDTGSTDGTADLARSLGCTVTEVGEKFITIIDEETAKQINERFVVDGEQPIVEAGNRLFDFATARNFATSLAMNDMICTLDCDEAYTKFDIDKLNFLISTGWEQFEYQFVFAHDGFGRPMVQFVQSKFFDRRKMKWTGIVHEVLSGNAKRVLVGEDTIKLEHWQEPMKEHRSNYLVGLAVDCIQCPENDRASHYLAREMLWTGRPKSALKEFERHISMNGWGAERAQSMIFMGDCYGMINNPEKQVEWYHRAFYNDSNRREALIKLAKFYQHNNQPQTVAVYAKAALEISWTDYYANDRAMYEHYPHELLYWAYGWMGRIDLAREHLMKALKYQPHNPIILKDTKYYFEYPANDIDGWMTFEELTWLYETAKRHYLIGEVGSWKGRSTHALATGMGEKGKIIAIDTWEGSDFVKDDTNWLAKQEDIFAVFKENIKSFKNIDIEKGKSPFVSNKFVDKAFDVVFIDAGHTYEDVKADIEAWLPKAKMVLCGHDYLPDVWMGVIQAVDEKFGKPDGVAGSIWYKYLVPKISIILPTLGRPEGLKRCLDSIEKLNYPKDLIETIVIDGEGTVPQKVARGLWQAKGEYIVYAANDTELTPDCIYNALQYKKGLVAFNTGKILLDDGNINEHFIIKKDFIQEIGGEIFDTEFHHLGVDNLLWAKAKKLNEAVRADDAIVYHYHFSKGHPKDEVYEKGWGHVEEDRALLAKKLSELQ